MTGDAAPRELDAEQAEGLVELEGAQDGRTPFVGGLTGESEQEIGRQDAGKVRSHTDKSNRSRGQISATSGLVDKTGTNIKLEESGPKGLRCERRSGTVVSAYIGGRDE